MNPKNMTQVNGRTHTFHAEAGVLHARLELPIMQDIKPQAFSKLSPGGGYLSQHAHNYQLEGIVSYRAAYTQVAGNKDEKKGPRHAWTTVATAVVEHLNVLDVVTADRVVAQISTDHPLEGYVPHISFLGTRFENLRIAGHKVDIDLDLLGTGADEKSPHEGNKGLMERIEARNQEFNDPEWLPDWYEEFEDFFDPLGAVPHEDEGVDPKLPDVVVKGSLVRTSKFPSPKDSYPGECFGKVINVPGFGKIHLATVHINRSKFTSKEGEPKKTEVSLSMLKLKMGCIAAGTMAIGNSRVNAGSHP